MYDVTFVVTRMINCEIYVREQFLFFAYLQLAALHFDYVLHLIDCELHRNKRQHRFRAVSVPPEKRMSRAKREKKIISPNFILYKNFSIAIANCALDRILLMLLNGGGLIL